MTKLTKAQGRLNGLQPIGVVDIGSNSVRLVIYEGGTRSPTVLFNEKVMCGLGQGLNRTGLLDNNAIDMTLRTMRRFHDLARQLQVVKIYALATAAAREAKNGTDFIAQAQEILGVPIDLLSGEREAIYSAYGVLSSFHRAHGLVGDFGGGSLELIALSGKKIGEGISLPLGGLRLRDMAQGDIGQAVEIVRQQLRHTAFSNRAKGQNFYAVGGTWRNLAKLHMQQKHYLLPVVHHYQPEIRKFLEFLHRVAKGANGNLRGIEAISKNRRQLLPYGAVALAETIKFLKPEQVIFSGSGMREGYLYAALPAHIRDQDPLLAAAQAMSILRARSPEHAHELIDWTAQAFSILGLVESKAEKRLREATCYLSDIAWRINSDYRGQDAADQIAFGDYNGIDHQGRYFAALTLFFRNQGLVDDSKAPAIIALMDDRTRYRARALAAIMRIANLFCASSPGILPQLEWRKEGDEISLAIPNLHAGLIAERPQGRLQQLVKHIGMAINFRII